LQFNKSHHNHSKNQADDTQPTESPGFGLEIADDSSAENGGALAPLALNMIAGADFREVYRRARRASAARRINRARWINYQTALSYT